jgi:hypothetical protein
VKRFQNPPSTSQGGALPPDPGVLEQTNSDYSRMSKKDISIIHIFITIVFLGFIKIKKTGEFSPGQHVKKGKRD